MLKGSPLSFGMDLRPVKTDRPSVGSPPGTLKPLMKEPQPSALNALRENRRDVGAPGEGMSWFPRKACAACPP